MMRSWGAAVALIAIFTGSQASTPVEYLDSQTFKTGLQQDVTVMINLTMFRENIACSLITPDGEEIDLNKDEDINSYTTIMTDELHEPSLQVLEDGGSKISCGVTINVVSEDYVGDWVLVATESYHGFSTEERRLNFTIYVEEKVDTFPRYAAHVAEGNELHLQLDHPMPAGSSCQVRSPNPSRQVSTTGQECAFTVTAVEYQDGGIWEITYGEIIVYKATFELTVVSVLTGGTHEITVKKHASVNEEVGPKEALYCTLLDARRTTVYENFGQCRLVVDRVTEDHAGVWSMMVALPGKVHVTEFHLQLRVAKPEAKPQVVTSVHQEKPSIFLSCSVASRHQVQLCKFQNPSGEVLISSPGVGEGRYKYYGDGGSSTPGIQSCGLELTSTSTSDLGLWRCGIETEEDTYYGFVKVLCPWAMMDPVVAASVVSEPTLAAESTNVAYREDDVVTMRCNVKASIKYCYFRSSNGSLFSVNPEASTPGFDAGECSMRLDGVSLADEGEWSCHAGLMDPQSKEQRANFRVEVIPKMRAYQFVDWSGRLVVKGDMNDFGLDYCRFVRIDGLGFTSDNVPQRYTSESDLELGHCAIATTRPTIIEHHPWTVVAVKDGKEYRATTKMSLPMPEIFYRRNGFSALFWALIFVVLPAVVMVLLLSNQRGREWTARRASSIRSSFRRSTSYNTTPQVAVANDKEVTKVPLA